MLVAIGTIEIGTAFFRYDMLNKQVRNAARYLTDNALFGSTGVIVTDSRYNALVAAAQNLVVYGTTVAGNTPLLPDLAVDDVFVEQAALANHIEVRAVYVHPLILGGALGGLMTATGFPSSLTLTASAVMPVP